MLPHFFNKLTVVVYVKLILSVMSHPFIHTHVEANYQTFKYNDSDLPFVTSWPLKAGFPGLTVQNLNNYISLFPRCLTVVHNYQGIEMKEWKIPIFLFRFDITVLWNKYRAGRRYIPFEKIPPIYNRTEESIWESRASNHLPVSDSRFNCYAQFDLFYPEKLDAFHYYFWIDPIIIFPRIREQEFYGSFGRNLEKSTQETYIFLVCLQNATVDSKAQWYSIMKHISLNYNTQKLFILTTEMLPSQISAIVPPTTRIIRKYFNYPYCYPDSGLVFIDLTHDNHWLREASDALSFYDGSITIEVQNFAQLGGFYHSHLEDSVPVLLNILQTKMGFRWYGSEMEFTSILFNNFSLKYGTSQERNRMPVPVCDLTSPTLQGLETVMEVFHPTYNPGAHLTSIKPFIVYRQDNVVNNIFLGTDKFTFLCCGETLEKSLNFYSVFLAFDLTTSSLIIATLIIWPVLFSLFENNFDVLKVISDLDGLILGIVAILEQGQSRLEKSNATIGLVILMTSYMLSNIVLSNAFKGNNIQSAIEKIKPIPYETFDQLIENGFDIYDLPKYIVANPKFTSTQFTYAMKESRYQYGNHTKIASKLKRHQKALEVLHHNWTKIDRSDLLRSCSKTAIVGWVSDLESDQHDLKNISNVFLGEEKLFFRYLGIKVLRWNDQRLQDKMSRVRDSGIQMEWNTISFKKPPEFPIYPESVRLKGNVVVQFLIYGICVVLASLSYIIEQKATLRSWIIKGSNKARNLFRKASKVSYFEKTYSKPDFSFRKSQNDVPESTII